MTEQLSLSNIYIYIKPQIFIVRSDAVDEAPILWPLDAKSQLIGKEAGAGKD